MSRKALGRGLRALIPESARSDYQIVETQQAGSAIAGRLIESPTGDSEARDRAGEGVAPGEILQRIPIDLIIPNRQQPRSEWEPEPLEELAKSIITRGLLEPIILRPSGDKYEIVVGERRWRACKIVGWTEIPAIVRSMEDHESLEAALIENIQRTDLNPVDEARAYRTLAAQYGLTHDEIAHRVGKNRTTITNMLRILKLSDDILRHVSRGTLSIGHARVLLGVPEKHRSSLVARIVKESWSVRETESRARRLSEAQGRRSRRAPRVRPKPEHLSRIEEELCRRLSAEVRVRMGHRGGRLEIRYHDDEDLSRLLELLGVNVA